MLKINSTLKSKIANAEFTVIKKLGEGGQGEVYLVEGAGGKKAVKWYNRDQSTVEQQNNISKLIMKGPPEGTAGRRFVWPLDIVLSNEDNNCFGYLMELIDMSVYAEIGEIWANKKPTPRLLQKCIASHEIVNSYRALHLSGYCYRDISRGNVIIDPATGHVLICDNDNIGVNQSSVAQIKGTMEYMAPEVILGKSNPSIQTDLYSLAVLLFQIWVNHHPLDGYMEYSIKCWDMPAKRKVYGEEPTFIFDPYDKRNRLPDDPEYDTPRIGWHYCPEPLKTQFLKAFTEGVKNPDKRVTEGEWQDTFIEIMNNILLCPHDKAEIVCFPETKEPTCWHCGKKLHKPAHLMLKRAGGNCSVLLTASKKITYKTVDKYADENEGAQIIAQVVQNPNNPQIWGVKNLTDTNWIYKDANGSEQQVPNGRSAPITVGNSIIFPNGTTAAFQ